MKLWMRRAASGAAFLVFTVLLVYRSGARVGWAHIPDERLATTALPDPDLVTRGLIARSCAKSRITDELIARRLSLLEAGAAFRDADAQWPATPVAVMIPFPQSSSLDEAYCRSVLCYVGQQSPPDLSQKLTHDLETELADRLRDGTLRLPDP